MNKLCSFLDRSLGLSERLEEVLFGLIMVLTFTLGAGSIVAEGKEATRAMLLGALGCNVAWGLISGMMFVLKSMSERSRSTRMMDAVQQASGEEQALTVVRDEFEPDLIALTAEEERERLYRHIVGTVKSAVPSRTRPRREDLVGAMLTFLVVFLTAVPAIVPFLFIANLFLALRVSNLLLIGLLFLVGYRWGRVTHTNPWAAGLAMTLAGLVVVGVAVALGG